MSKPNEQPIDVELAETPQQSNPTTTTNTPTTSTNETTSTLAIIDDDHQSQPTKPITNNTKLTSQQPTQQNDTNNKNVDTVENVEKDAHNEHDHINHPEGNPNDPNSLAYKKLKYPKPKSFELDSNGRNLEERAWLWSLLSFGFITPLITLGFKRPLTLNDLYPLNKQQDSFYKAPQLEQHFNTTLDEANEYNDIMDEENRQRFLNGDEPIEFERRHGDVTKAAIRHSAILMIWLLLLQLGSRVIQLSQPYVLSELLMWLANDSPIVKAQVGSMPDYYGYLMALLLAGMYFLSNLLDNLFYHFGYRNYAEIRCAINAMIYTKSLKIASFSSLSFQKAIAGGPGGGGGRGGGRGGRGGATATTRGGKGRGGNDGGRQPRTEQQPTSPTTTTTSPTTSTEQTNDNNDTTTSPTQQQTQQERQEEQAQQQEKASNASKVADSQLSVGAITNLMSTDSDKVGMIFFFGVNIFLVPIQIAVALYLIYRVLGAAIFAGLGVILFVMPLSFISMILMAGCLRGKMMFADKRVKLTMEVLNGIRVLKYQGWEYFQFQHISDVRDLETSKLLLINIAFSIVSFVMNLAQPLITVVTFLVYASTRDNFDPVIVFQAVSLIQVLQMPIIQLPNSLTTVLQGLVSANRLNAYFSLPELERYKKMDCDIISRRGLQIDGTLQPRDTKFKALLDNEQRIKNKQTKEYLSQHDASIIIENGSFTWVPPNDNPYPNQKEKDLHKQPRVLHNIDCTIKKGSLTAIIGPVGSGKSSLVQSLLEELTKLNGHVYRDYDQSIAYVSQTAWIQTVSIRDNITWSQPLNTPQLQQRYDQTLSACCLIDDLKTFDHGDLTQVGSNGLSLSGGQRARTSLARACFANSDIYILDDILSALDAHVSESIFARCVEDLLSDKTRIVVTNQLHYLQRCDYIYILGQTNDPDDPRTSLLNDDGTIPDDGSIDPNEIQKLKDNPIRQCGVIKDHGTYQELSQRPILTALLHEYTSSLQQQDEKAKIEREKKLAEIEELKQKLQLANKHNNRPGSSSSSAQVVDDEQQPTTTTTTTTNDEKQPIEIEKDDHNDDNEYQGYDEMPGYEQEQDILGEFADPASRIASHLSQLSRRNHLHQHEHDEQLLLQTTAPNQQQLQEQKLKENLKRFEKWELQAAKMKLEQYHKGHDASIVGGTVAKGQQLSTEEIQTKSNTFGLLSSHLATMGGTPFITITLLVAILSQGCIAALTIVLSYWSDDSWNKDNHWYIQLYGILLACAALLLILRGILWSFACVASSKFYFAKLLYRVLRATPTFFDTTPVGRIIGRFSDLDQIDTMLPNMLLFLITMSAALVASLVSISVLQPWFIIAAVVVIFIFWGMLKFASPTSVQLKRLDSLTRSPVLQHFTESCQGLGVIRAANKADEFQEKFFHLANANTNTMLLSVLTIRWLSLRTGWLVAILLLVCGLLVCGTRSTIAVGTSGAIMNFALGIGGSIGFLLVMAIDVFSRLSAIERLRYYSDHTPLEGSLEHGITDVVLSTSKKGKILHTKDPNLQYKLPPQEKYNTDPNDLSNLAPLPQSLSIPEKIIWPPKHFDIVFSNVWMKYRPELPYVLKGMNITIPQGFSVGVVGRTGSGKSSFLMNLLRLYEIQRGSITIGDYNIAHLPIHLLRTTMSIIPQEPVLYSGTIRSNLDPFNHYSDEQLLHALTKVGFKDTILAMDGGLNALVAENASNFSNGERQLIAFARFLLRKDEVKFACLDESTASISVSNEKLIQECLQNDLKHCTVICIAHRLASIINMDRILVLDQGTLAEWGPPSILIAAPTTNEPQIVPSDDPNDPNPIITRGIFASLYREYIKSSEENSNSNSNDNSQAD